MIAATAVPEDLSLPGLLRDDYASGRLALVSRTGDTLVLRATAPPCASPTFFSEVAVDAETFQPRTAVSYDICIGEEGTPVTPQERSTWRFEVVRSLPATPENLRLMNVGN